MYINRVHLKNIEKFLLPQKAVVILGPRRCGKTTLLNKFLEKRNRDEILFVNGESVSARKPLESQSIETLQTFIGRKELLVIDEAQRIKNVGVNLKLVVDHIEGIRVIATGSSAFDLAKLVGEPLTGRKFTLMLFPLAQLEIKEKEDWHETQAHLEDRLIYGSYPEIIVNSDNLFRRTLLEEIVGSYLYRDILELDGIRHSDKIIQLLELLAFQIGKEVSYNELGNQLNMNRRTVERYLDLLEKTFVIFHVRGFSRNLRKEVTKNPRYYFFDNGIRNAVINNFNPLRLRNDVGMLWENYIITERMKKKEYQKIYANEFFWRTYDQKEIDLVEEREGKLFGYEIKWGEKKKKPPKDWLTTYKNAEFQVIDRSNYLDFIT